VSHGNSIDAALPLFKSSKELAKMYKNTKTFYPLNFFSLGIDYGATTFLKLDSWDKDGSSRWKLQGPWAFSGHIGLSEGAEIIFNEDDD